MITATSSPDRFGSLLRGLLKKNISNMVYLALIGFIGIPLPYLLAMSAGGKKRDSGCMRISARPTGAACMWA